MKNIFVITALCALLAAPAFAQDKKEAEEAATPPTAEEVDAAASAVAAVAEDKTKADGYCAIMKEMEGLKEGDDKAAEELGQKMDTYLASLGEEVQAAFATAEEVDPASAEYTKVDEAFGKLEEACGS